MNFDVIVLGAGMVGVSAALQLQERGRKVALIDRRGVGEETSYGNAGIVEREGLLPMAIPRDFARLVRYAFNRAPEANYHPTFLPRIAPFLWRLFEATGRTGLEAHARSIDTLGRFAIPEHRRLAQAAEVLDAFRDTGWLRLYRTSRGLAADALLHDMAMRYGIEHRPLAPDEVRAMEPDLKPGFHAGVFWPETQTVTWPERVSKAYGRRFEALGGKVLRGDARTLKREDGRWTVVGDEGEASAPVAVVALGPWSVDFVARFGIDLPVAAERGYHRHYGTERGARLGRPIVDVEAGYCLNPMERGLRLTTGIEFADRDAPATPRQLAQIEPMAREIFPLGAPVEAEPWLGSRPATADGLPVLGPAPGVPDLWLDFGHGYLGFTLGPISGRLIAEAICGEPTLVDLTPFRAERFGGGR
ncbi:MAG: FAD-binding oxidoreductase [Hyphomicrobiales bacterium]|nr:FAD-binding oxidoreductase [Hyphomicrobiales bacterium]